MPYKQSPREKMLRRIAASVKDSMGVAIGTGRPEDRPYWEKSYEEQLTFLRAEIHVDRHMHCVNPPPVKRL